MEKIVVFGPMIVFLGIFALLIFGFFGLIIKLVLKSKNENWTGIIIDKKHNQVRDSDSHGYNDFYYLVVKLDSGKERKIGLSASLWSGFKIGDKLTKPKGKLFPEKI
jgi:hypothetical protein